MSWFQSSLSQDGKLWSFMFAAVNHPARVPEYPPQPSPTRFAASTTSPTSIEEAPPASYSLLVPYFVIQGSPGVATVTPTSLTEPITY